MAGKSWQVSQASVTGLAILHLLGSLLVDNPICQETGVTKSYCFVPQTEPSYSTPPNNCVAASCSDNQISSPNCECALPYTGLLQFRAPSFSNLENSTYYTVLQKSLMNSFMLHQLPVDSVALSSPRKDSSHYLVLNLQVFPVGQDRFNRTGISSIGFELSNQTFKPPPQFGPFFFIANPYLNFAGEVTGSKKSSNTGVIIGAAAGGCVLLLLLLGAGLYAHRQKKRAEKATEQNNPFAHWESNKSIGGIPQLKGARNFSFEELRKYTNNFSETNDIGSGGYGNVYRGVLPTGELVAIKRAQQGSMQGGGKYVVREVKTALDRAKHLYNLGELLDSSIGLDITLKGLDKYVDVALKCVQENGSDRPTMGEVVKEIENILQLAGLNPNADSASTSASYDDASKGGAKHPYIYSKDAFDYSGGFPVPKLEPL
ncbi:hypothetical protein OIU84_023271 [Salix udensis]|uniref:Protein kinase domain-containing protein n=1 Tax=Salix udensis TaxID=889485 RepID=A0AAD6KQU5_9ROSI|nr:hypothetical protein OIU84_023271 [Salix udensis]